MIAPRMYSLESYEPAIINNPQERKQIENNLRRVLTEVKPDPQKYNVNLINRLNMNNQLAINNNITNKNLIYNNVNPPTSINLIPNNQVVFPLLANNIQNNQIFANFQNNNLINPNFGYRYYNNPLSSNYKYNNQLLNRNYNNNAIYRNKNQNIIMGIPNKTNFIQHRPNYIPINNSAKNYIYNIKYKKPFYEKKNLYRK